MRRDGFVSGTLSPNLQNRMEISSCWEEQEFQWFPSSLQLEAVQLLAWLEAGSTSPGGPLPQGGGRETSREESDKLWVAGLRLVTEPPGLRSGVAAGESVPSCVAVDISGCRCPANQ